MMSVTAKEIKEAYVRWQTHQKELHAYLTTPAGELPADRDARVTRARKDYAYFVSTYFPHLARKACGKFQLDAAEYIRRNPNARCVFEWARGHAKSTHISLMIPLWLKIQENRSPMVMILASKSEDAADRLLSELQGELQYNRLFISDYGKQVKEGSWQEGEFHTADGDMFISYGRGQSPRGIKERGHRPNYIVIDDIDDDEMVRNDKRVNLALEWCLTALLGTMEMGRGRFTMVGNRIAKNSVLAKMAERPHFHHTVVNALDRKGRPSWPENYTLDEIQALREVMGERNFQKEYMNNPITEGAVFRAEWMRYAPVLKWRQYKALVCYTDPSFKASTQNDYKATILVGLTKTGEYHVLKAFADQTTVSDMIAWHYQISMEADRQGVVVPFYMESNFMQDLILDEFRKAGEDAGWQLPIRGDKRKKADKFSRIESMQPLFERGLVVFNEAERTHPGMICLEEQLLMTEKGSRTHDDAPDALESAVWMLNHRERAGNSEITVIQRKNRKW